VRVKHSLFLILIFFSVVGVALPSFAADDVLLRAKTYRAQHEKDIIEQYSTFLSLPNVATDYEAIHRNALYIQKELAARGFKTQLLAAAPKTPEDVFGERLVPGATHTIVFYAHYDGQPVAQPDWRSDPFKPVVREAGQASAKARDVDWRNASQIDSQWRIYARSASDDKAHVQAMLSALDVLSGVGAQPKVNIKVFYEGEEEQGSPHLGAILKKYGHLLKGDFLLLCDGPRHQTDHPLLLFGARGIAQVDITVYGPLRPLHDGSYGNWAPNPAAMLVHLLASLRDDNSHILIPGFYDDVGPLNKDEREAYAALPDVDAGLKKELALGRTEASEKLPVAITQPALNIRGIRVGDVGDKAANIISTEARASLDFRLAPGQKPERVRELTEDFVRAQGWFIIHGEPDAATRAAHSKVIRLDWALDYAGYRADLGMPVAKTLAGTIEATIGGPVIKMPMVGGSLPMSIFADALQKPIIVLSTVNYDNNQHAANENLRLKELWESIDIYVGLLTSPNW